MTKPTLTPELCWAAGADLANAHMRRHGRKAWSREDGNVFAKEYNRLYAIYDGGALQRMADDWEAQHNPQPTGE